MISSDRILAAIAIIWIFSRTLSYGRWTWKKKNKLGGAMIIFLAFAAVILTVFQVFFKR